MEMVDPLWNQAWTISDSSKPPMQGSAQEHHQEGWSCQDQGGDEPGAEV